MCGRFTQTHSGEAIAAAFGLARTPNPAPRYNIAPSQPVAAIAHPASDPTAAATTAAAPSSGREYRIFQWGLIPSWAKDPAIGHRMINARAETAAEKPSFRTAFKRRRCLIVADGFYEWQKPSPSALPRKDAAKPTKGNPKKQPYYIQMRDRTLFW